MKGMDVFDPALCCTSGVCGTDVDQALVDFSADVAWAKAQGAQIARFNLAQQPMEFAKRPVVAAALERGGQEALPICLLGGQVMMSGRYPTRAELQQWLGLGTQTDPVAVAVAASSCYGPGPRPGCC
jgi:hypothetical protein